MGLKTSNYGLRFLRVSRQRTDLQDDSRWPFPVMPHGFGSIGQRWTGLKSDIGWMLILVESETPVDIKTKAD